MNRKRRRARVPIALVLALVGSSCYSHSPLDSSPQVRLDRRVLGAWRCVSPDPDPGAASVTFAAAAGNERGYDIKWQEPEKEPESYRAFISSVSGASFFNVRTEPDEGWAFVRYSFPRPTVLYLEMARHELFAKDEASASPKAARATLEKALRSKSPALEELCVCVRVSASSRE